MSSLRLTKFWDLFSEGLACCIFRMRHYILQRAVLHFIVIFLLLINVAYASGGFDHGTPVGKNRSELDFTLNPADIIPYGQSYVVLSYGFTRDMDFHGYFSHEAKGVDQYYYGLMHRIINNSWLDFSIGIGRRHRLEEIHIFFPEWLYTIKLPNNFFIGGSIVDIKNSENNEYLGTTFDIAFFMPIDPFSDRFSEPVPVIYLAIGLFKPLSNVIYPTYSIDIKL
jgi:hypothetical protein